MNKRIMISLALICACAVMHTEAMSRRTGQPEAMRRGRGQRQRSPEMQEHKRLQQQFRDLQINLHMQPADQQTMKWRFPVHGRQGTQAQLNKVRSELNRLLSQRSLDKYDIINIQQKINELKRLNPARWPQPSDYEAMLQQTQ